MEKQVQSASKQFGRCWIEGAAVGPALKRAFVQPAHFPATRRHEMWQPRFRIKSEARCCSLEPLSEAPGYLALAPYRGLPSNKGAAHRRLTPARLCCHKAAPASSAGERRR